jgi:hypothetical protein
MNQIVAAILRRAHAWRAANTRREPQNVFATLHRHWATGTLSLIVGSNCKQSPLKQVGCNEGLGVSAARILGRVEQLRREAGERTRQARRIKAFDKEPRTADLACRSRAQEPVQLTIHR